jgi:hypothetical protein
MMPFRKSLPLEHHKECVNYFSYTKDEKEPKNLYDKVGKITKTASCLKELVFNKTMEYKS